MRYPLPVSDETPERQGRRISNDVLLVLRIVHVSIVLSIFVYVGVVFMVTRPPPADAVIAGLIPKRPDPPALLAPIMASVAVTTLLAVLFLRRRLARRPTTAGWVTCWALTELVAIDGLLLGMVYRDMARFLPFAAVSLAVMLLLAPRRRYLEAHGAADEE